MSILSEEQVRLYSDQSYLLVSGLIPDDVTEAAAAAMWRLLQADPADPESWQRVSAAHAAFESPELLACFTPDMLAAASLLAGPGETLPAPARAYAINVFPKPGEWRWPRPHIDHAIKEHGHKTFP